MDANDFLGDISSTWPEHVRRQLLASIRKALLLLDAPVLTSERVHRARRVLKEAHALALLLEGMVGPSARLAACTLRAIRRALSDTRDFDVMLETLDRLAPGQETGSLESLRKAIAKRRNIAAGSATERSSSVLRSDLLSLSVEASAWRMGAGGHAEFAFALVRSYRKAKRLGKLAFAKRLPPDLHRLRKALIVYRVQLAAFESAWPKLVNAWCSEAQNLRDALGSYNDLSVLETFVSAHEPCEPQTTKLLTSIESRRRDAVACAEPIFRRVFSARPRQLRLQMEALLASPKNLPELPPRSPSLEIPAKPEEGSSALEDEQTSPAIA